MPFDASGDLTRIHNWVFDKNAGIKIIASRMDAEFDNVVSAINDILQGNAPFKASIKGPFGTAGAPTFTFKDDTDTGLFRHGANELAISAGGTTSARFTPTGPAFGDGQDIKAYIDSRGFAGPPTIQSFTGNGSNVNFTLAAAPVSENALLVTVAGVVQHHDAFSVASDVLTFTTAPGSGAAIEVMDLSSHAVIDTVAVQTVVQNMAAIIDAPNQATAAANSASAAATSETNAGNSASAAAASASNAATSEINAGNSASAAATSETNAGNSASAANTSATNAATSETNAGNSATAAGNSATAAGTSETNAGNSATASAASAGNAATSETNAANSATAAAAAQTAAETAQTGAEAAEATATTKAQEAAASAGVAPAMQDYVRSEYSIATRPPSVIMDLVRNLFMRSIGVCDYADLVNHVRNSAAVSTNGAGVIVSSASDAPRIDHHVLKDGIWQRAGLRVDTQATNLLETSEDFSSSTWTKTNITLTSGYATAPDGTNTASRIESTATSSVRLRNGNSAVPAGPATFSVYLKADTCNHAQLLFNSIGPTSFVWFDLANGAVGTTTGVDVSGAIEDVGDGWYRCSATNIIPAIDSGEMELRIVDGDGVSSVSVGDAILVWGAQFETNATPTSYIKTTGTVVTRADDVISMVSATIPSPENGFTVVAEGTVDWLDTDSGTHTYLFEWYKTASPSEIIRLGIEQAGGVVSRAVGQAYKGAWSESEAPAPFDQLGQGLARPFRVAFTLSPTHVQTVTNGEAYAQVALPNGVPDPSSVAADLLENFNGTLTRLRIFDTALPEAALITETTI